MKIVGLTGGIGSGKSTVARLLAALGATVIDVDRLARDTQKPGTEVWRELVAAFGCEILNEENEIDRSKLGKIVFGRRELLVQLNQITHPRLYRAVQARLEELRKQGVAVVIVEVPLLIEAGWTKLVDEVWATEAAEDSILKRLQERNKLSRQEALARMHSQLSNKERFKQADVIINTDCDLQELNKKVSELWARLVLATDASHP